MFTLSRTQDGVHRGAHALLHHSGALETRPCDVFGDGAYKRPCACVIFPVSTFPVCSFDGLYISFTHSSMFVLLYLFDARHVGGVGWGGGDVHVRCHAIDNVVSSVSVVPHVRCHAIDILLCAYILTPSPKYAYSFVT